MITFKPELPELIAPAGNYEAFLAALNAGADAVYLGVEDFNARRNAPNFTLDALPEICELAHLAGRRIYLTLNTMILPDEMRRALAVAHRAWEAGVDALIVSDLGLLTSLAVELPQFKLHASTQMNLHASEAVRLAADLGASRVTLSRELSLEEIAQVAQAGVPLEVFAHGALCVCYSGQCLFSSLVGRRSANRGLCAQACRLPYQLIDTSTDRPIKVPGKHLLSPRDLATIDILPELIVCGVSALKIEGRMKSAAYVATVTRVYREALDKLYGDKRSIVTENASELLAETFSRGFSTAYLEDDRTNSMMSYTRPNNQGVFAGRVAALEKGLVGIALTKRITRGDVLEFRTIKGQATVTLDRFWSSTDKNSKPLDEADAGTRIYIRVAEPVSMGDRVFRVRNAELINNAESTFDNTVFQGNNGLVSIAAKIIARLGQELCISFTACSGRDAGEGSACEDTVSESSVREGSAYKGAENMDTAHEGTACGLLLEPARTKALTEADIKEHVGRVGGTPFRIISWDIQLDEGVGCGFSELHKLRAQALEDLKVNMLSSWYQRPVTKAEKPAALAPARKGKAQIAVIVRNLAGARAALEGGAELIYFHSLRFDAEHHPEPQGGLKLKSKVPVSLLLPAITRDAELDSLLSAITPSAKPTSHLSSPASTSFSSVSANPSSPASTSFSSVSAYPSSPASTSFSSVSANAFLPHLLTNYKSYVANNLAQIHTLMDTADKLEAGPSLGICNAEALALMARLGLTQAWLSPELSSKDIAAISPSSPLPLTLTIVGRQEVMTTEHCILMAQGPCEQNCLTCARRKAPRLLEDQKGYRFPVRTDDQGRSHLFNAVELDLVPFMPELISLGISTFVVDGTLLTTKDLRFEVERAIRARDIGVRGAGSLPKREGYTTGHFFRGVY